jgi:hypothetical protein
MMYRVTKNYMSDYVSLLVRKYSHNKMDKHFLGTSTTIKKVSLYNGVGLIFVWLLLFCQQIY